MRRILFLGWMALLASPVFSQTILLECGQNSGNNFNGWYIYPHAVFDEIEFDAHSLSFFSEFGGNYSVNVSRKIDEMKSFKELDLLFNFEAAHNCDIENVVYSVSSDGKHWTPLNMSRNNTAIRLDNSFLDIAFVKATANAIFHENGKLSLNYAKIGGLEKNEPELAVIELEEDPFEESFFIFNHQNSLNIETALDAPYEVLITSINGQIIYREAFEGSKRIDLPTDVSGIHIITIIQENAFKASKKVLF